MRKYYQSKNKKETALYYIDEAKKEGIIIRSLEKEIREHKKKLTYMITNLY